MDPLALKAIFLSSIGLGIGFYLAQKSHERGGWISRHWGKLLAGYGALSLATFVVFVTGY